MTNIRELCSRTRQQLNQWAEEVAHITRLAWSCENGVFHFPYFNLSDPDYWQNKMGNLMDHGKMKSWVYVVEGNYIVAHVSLIKKFHEKAGEYWELGRMVCHPDFQHRGIMMQLAHTAIHEVAQVRQYKVLVECTQANTYSQRICQKLGLRFAGIGILDHGDETDTTKATWDIIYFDNLNFLGDHTVVRSQPWLNSCLAQVQTVQPGHVARLQHIKECISIAHGGQLPPIEFHILPEYEKNVRRIIAECLSVNVAA